MENSLESQAKWYVLHTYSGYEAMVKASLEQLIENNNLQNNIFDHNYIWMIFFNSTLYTMIHCSVSLIFIFYFCHVYN